MGRGLAIGVCILALAGCGGSDEERSAPGSDLGATTSVPGGSAAGAGTGPDASRRAPGRDGADAAGRRRATRPAFAAAADRICRAAQREAAGPVGALRRLALSQSRRRRPAAQFLRRSGVLVGRVHAVAQRAVARLAALPRPPERRIDRFLALVEARSRALGAHGAALRRGDVTASRRASRRRAALTAQTARLGRALGLRVCGR